MTYAINIPGKPRGKGRPRFSRVSGHTYTDSQTAVYENLVKTIWLSAIGKKLDGELAVHIDAYYAIPSSKPKKMQEAMRSEIIRPTVKPDIDNVIKAVLDGLNGVAFNDDTQVVELVAGKWYSTEPHVIVCVSPLNQAQEDDSTVGAADCRADAIETATER